MTTERITRERLIELIFDNTTENLGTVNLIKKISARIASGQPIRNLIIEIVLFITQGVNGTKFGSSYRRGHAKDYANSDRKPKG